jgi:hypothetical protein
MTTRKVTYPQFDTTSATFCRLCGRVCRLTWPNPFAPTGTRVCGACFDWALQELQDEAAEMASASTRPYAIQ